MAKQDDPTTMSNIELAISQALYRTYKITVGRVLAYKEIGPNQAPVVDVQIGPQLLSNPVDGRASVATDIQPVRNVPLLFFQAGDFTISTKMQKGQHVLCLVGDRERDSWMRGDGSTYRPSIPGQIHNLNALFALPFLEPEQFLPSARPTTRQLFIGDKTGKLATIKLNSGSGGGVEIEAASQVTVKAPTVNVEGGQVNIGSSTGAPIAPIARTNLDYALLPTIPVGGHPGGPLVILPGPFPVGPASSHLVKG